MPPALDRLLASSSALRLLRASITTLGLPAEFLNTTPTIYCSCRSHPRRAYQLPRRPLVDPKWSKPKANKINRKPHTLDTADLRLPNGQTPYDARTWAESLQQQWRLAGYDGIRRVWNARQGVFDLPASDTPDAKFLWATFFRVPDLVLPTILHAADVRKRSGQLYPHLYELCMSYWLPQEHHIAQVPIYHHQFLFHLQLRKLPLQTLARRGKQTFTPRCYAALMEIYRTSNETDIYDEVVPVLCARGSLLSTKQWHTLCTTRGDYPSPEVASMPSIQKLTAGVSHIADPKAQLVHLYAGSMEKKNSKLNGDLLRRLQGRDTAPVRFDDALCAKLFATRSFSVESVIKGLTMVGVNEVGPLAVRAMATTVESDAQLLHSFHVLKAHGIALQGKVFCLALEKFASDERWNLVHSMLESDQHSDVYDSMDLQKKLLGYYLQQNDMKQAHRTLAIMSLFHTDMGTEAWNLLLQAQVSQFEPHQILHTLECMREKGIAVATPSLVALKSLLRHRRRTRRPGPSSRGKFDDLRFVTRVFLMIMENGSGKIFMPMWRELIRRYGMTGRLRELRRVLFRLFSHYAPHRQEHNNVYETICRDVNSQNHTSPRSNGWSNTGRPLRNHAIRKLFPASLQQGLIVWGFRHGLLANSPWEQSMLSGASSKKRYRRRLKRKSVLRPLDWSIGIQTLVELRDLGLHVHQHTVVKALQGVFVNLFDRRGRSKSRDNNRMKRANTTTYSEYVRCVNRMWGQPLFTLLQLNIGFKMLGLAWHPRHRRRIMHRPVYHLDLEGVPKDVSRGGTFEEMSDPNSESQD